MSDSPCESVDAAAEKEGGDMGCSVSGGSYRLVHIWKGMRTPLDEIRVFVLFGLTPSGRKKSVDCEVRVLELTPLSICLVTMVKMVGICFAHLCNCISRTSRKLSTV